MVEKKSSKIKTQGLKDFFFLKEELKTHLPFIFSDIGRKLNTSVILVKSSQSIRCIFLAMPLYFDEIKGIDLAIW